MSDLLWPDRAIGVFETLLVVDARPIELDAHLARLSSSVQELFGAGVPDGAERLTLEHAAPLSLGRLRLTIAPAADGALAAEAVTASVDPENVFPSWERAVALCPLVIHGGLGAHKWADRNGLAWTESSDPDGGLPLVLDADREVLEASRANLFAVDSETLLTPPTDGRILPGVARACAIDAARSLGIEVREQPLTVDSVLAAGEAFLTGSVRGVEPVRTIGETELTETGHTVAGLAAEMKRNWIGDAILA